VLVPPVRALVRPQRDAGRLAELGADVALGDFRDPDSLRRAVTGVETVVSTVTVIARALAGEKDADFHRVDLVGHRELIAAAEDEVVIRPDQLQEIWLSPLAQFDWPRRKAIIFGKGERPTRYVASDDVAEAVVRLVLAADPPSSSSSAVRVR
jgi:hypothetical protein